MANTQNLDLVKPLGTDHALVSVLNSNSDKIDAYAGAVNAGLDGLRDGLGILADGNTHAAITSGQFVYVKNHQTLPQGLYQATTNIAANGTLSTSNLTADPKGGLNTLNEQIGNISGFRTYEASSGDVFKNLAVNTIPNGTLFMVRKTTITPGFWAGMKYAADYISAIYVSTGDNYIELWRLNNSSTWAITTIS